MPIFEYNGKKYNVPEDKVDGFLNRKPEAQLVNSAPFYLADDNPKVDVEVPKITPVNFDAELGKATQPQKGVSLPGGDSSIENVASDIYDTQKAEKQFKDSLIGQTSGLEKEVSDRLSRSILEETEAKNRKWDEDLKGATASQKAYASQARSAMANKPFEDMPESGNYSVADHFMKESNRIINEAGKSGGNLNAAARGAKDALFNPDTWSAGLSELDRNRRVEQAVKKYEQGEELSESEEKMLDALALNLAVNQHYGSDVKRGYKWGQIAGESAPFMLEMALNPLSLTGKGLAKSIAKYGISKFAAKGAGKLAVKAGARAVGDAVSALGMVATTGAPRTMSDAMSRMLGEATYETDDKGNVKYSGHQGGKGVVESVLKSIGSNVLEYQSEMLGSSGLGQVAGKIPGVKAVSKAVKASDFGKYVGKMNNSTLYREAKSLGKRAQWNGTIGEYGEEVYNQFMNALFIGDNKLSDLTDIDQQVDTFMGLALTGGAMSSLNTLSYSTDRVLTEKKVRNADQQASTLFDGWDEVKSQLSGMSAEERTETLRDVLKRENISIPAKKAFTDYVSGITYKESLAGAAEAKAQQDAETAKETGNRLYETLQDKRSIALNSLNIERQELEAQLGDLASLSLSEIEESPEATPEIINAARKYNIVKSEFDGVMDRLRSEIDTYIQPQIEAVEQVAKDGTITELNIGSTENPKTVYLLSGDISFNEDGTVNREASLSPTVNVKDGDGRKRQIGTHHVVSGKVDDLEQTKESIRQIAYEKYVNPLANKMEGKRHFELDETVEFIDDKGKTVAGKVNGKQGQTVQVLHSDGKTTSTFTETELDQRLIGETLGDVQIRDKFRVNIDGEMLDAEVQDISDGKATLYIPNNPVVAQRYMDVSLEELNQMRIMPVSGQQEIDITSEKTPENEGTTIGQTPQNVTETAETESESQNAAEVQAVQEFPKDKDGNIDYSKITDNNAYVEALRSEFGDEAYNVVDDYRKAAEKALKSVDKINDPIRKRREQARRQAELDRWSSMIEATRPKAKAPAYEEEYNPILTKNTRERESQMGDYLSLRDYLLRNIGTGKLRFMWNSRDGRTGLKDEILSSKNTQMERLRRIAFLDNNGFTPETLAEFISDNNGQDIPEFSTLDVQDIRNEINDVLLSFDTPTDMIEAAEKLRRDDVSLESYIEQNISPDEIANYEANQTSQDELLLTLPEQEAPDISEQELNEYYGTTRRIEDIEQYPDTERGVYGGTEQGDQIPLQAASSGIEKTEERATGEQGTRDSLAEPDQERAEHAIAGYGNQEDRATGTERKYSAGQIISIDGADHVISEAGTYVGTNDHFYTIEKDGQTVYEDITQDELDKLVSEKSTTEQPYGPSYNGDIVDYARNVVKNEEVKQEAAKVDTNPTDAQKEAGNYKKGHVNVQGFDITIENPKGSVRSGVDASGKKWSVEMKNHYGYFKRTEGYDGDQIDTFIGPNPESSAIFVVDQVNNDKSFDESKVMLGFNSIDEAREAYLSNYEAGWQGLGAITETTVDDFKKWLYDGAKQRKAFSEYKENKPEYGANNKIITTDRYNELREQMRKKLNNLNAGFDPEVFSIGAQMAMYHIESGANKFAEFAKRMVDDLGDAIRPYLKASYEGARAMPGMEELSKTMDPYNDVVAFDVNKDFNEDIQPINNNDNGQKERSTETIEAETETVETASGTIRSESENVGNNKQRAGQVKEKADDQIRKVEGLLNEIDQKLASLKLSDKEYSTEGIAADYPINVLAKGPIRKDVTAYVKAVAAMTGLDHDTNSKGKTEVVNINIAPAGGNASFILWGKDNPEYGVYVSIPYDPDISSGVYYDNYKVRDNHILWRVTTKQNKWKGLSNQSLNVDATAQEMAETILKGLNRYLRSIGLQEEVKPVINNMPDAEKNKKVKKKTSKSDISSLFDIFDENNYDNVSDIQDNSLTLDEGNEEVKPVNSNQNDKPRKRNEKADSSLGTGTRQEVGRTEQGGMDRSGIADNGPDRSGSGRIPGSPDHAEKLQLRNTNNNRNERGKDYSPKSPKARFNANITAIKLMRKLNDSGITVPTKEQMETLRMYSGWGGLGTFFDNDTTENQTLRTLLSDEEYQNASDSVRSAYYTPADVIDSLWDIAERLGFKGGSVLESSAGIGSIIGSMPQNISDRSTIEGVEIDSVSGEILKLLYPDAKIHVKGFENTNIRNGSVDLAITNVPFVTGLNVYDPVDKDLSRKFKNIHDFVIAKNIRKLKEGGIGIFITTKGTLDSSKKLREWIVSNGSADVIGAFRLNNETFEGTGVTSDIIVVRKRVARKVHDGAINVIETTIERSSEYETDDAKWVRNKGYVREVKEVDLIYNKYFADNPQFMGGEMAFGFEHGDTYRPTSISLYPKKGINQNERLSEWVKQFDPLKDEVPVDDKQKVRELEETSIKEGQLFIDSKGNIAISSRGLAEDPGINSNKVKGRPKTEVLKDYNSIKESVDALLKYQIDSPDDSGLKPHLDKLNKAYDDFVSKYGQLNNNTSISWLRKDVDFPAIAALEKYKEHKSIDGKKTINVNKTLVFKQRVIGYKSKPVPKNIKDAVVASVYEYNDINIPYISESLSISEDNVREQILSEGLGFSNPQTGAIEIRHRYLSGNVREKLRIAKDSNVNGEYDANIMELEKVVPMDIPAHLIDMTIGSTWVPPSIFEQYFMDRYGVRLKLHQTEGAWVITPGSKGGQYNDKNRQLGVYSEMFQETIFGDELAYAAMNNRNVVFKKIRKNYDGSQETITDKEASATATRRISEIKADFTDWSQELLTSNEEIAEKIMKTYNDKFNAIVPMSIDEKFIPEKFDGAATFINLYPHQLKSAVRATMQPLFLAHEVGTGKTFTIISAAMEMRRVGTAKKPMIVVQNATIGQFVAEAKTLYPNAKILALSDSDRDKKGRLAFYANIKYNDWDMVIIPQSTFDMIPDSPERQRTFIEEKIDEKIRVIEAMRDIDTDGRIVKQIEDQLEDLYDELAGRASKKKKKSADRSIAVDNAGARAKEQLDRRTDDVQYFDDLGVDALLVDEAHAYKKLGYETTMARGVKGIDTSRSKRAAGLYIKSRAILEKSGWKNFVLATGTPITNTAAELWTFMRFLLPKDTLIENDMYYFDDFAKNFGSIDQMLEFATSGKYKENTRFAKYINLAELVRIWASVSDTVLTKEAGYINDKVPVMETGQAQDVYLEQSDTLVDVMRAVRKKLEEFDKMSGKEKKQFSYIPIVMYGIAKRAAIDTRLIDKNSPDEPLSKTNKTVDEVLKSLKDTKSYNGTVAVFCDNQNRKDDGVVTFNIFEDIKQKLIDKGVPENQIIIMKSGMNIKQKQKIFADVNEGVARVIMGSTETLGTGVNIQERLHTLIHMDAPDLPMQYTQRMGRILRQGNLHKEWNKPVRVLRFGVVDSLDVTAYQRLQTKSNIIDSVMDGKSIMANAMENRSIEESSESGFGNTVAQLSGSQYALLKNHAEKELQKLLGKRKQHEYDQIYISNQVRRNEGIIRANESIIKDAKDRLSKIKSLFPEGKPKSLSIAGNKIEGKISIEEALKEYVNKPVNEFVENARKNTSYKTSILPFEVKADNVVFTVNVKITRDSAYDEKAKGLRISMRRNISYSSEQLNMEEIPVSGAYAREAINDILENVIPGKDDSERIEYAERASDRLRAENVSMNARKGKKFELDDDLREAEKKVEEYTILMQKELEEKEKKYNERGSGKDVNIESVELEDEEIESDETDTGYREDKVKLRLDDESGDEVMFRRKDDEAREAYAMREWNRAKKVVNELAEKMNVPVEIVETTDGLPKAKAEAKGWYDIKSKKIAIVMPNHSNSWDAQATFLHEAVGHHGLRELFGGHFDTFLDNVYNNAEEEIKAQIDNKAHDKGWDVRKATEEYLSELAEDQEILQSDRLSGFFNSVKKFFFEMLAKLGFNPGFRLSNNELKYILWRSYQNLAEPGRYRSIAGVAKDIAMQSELKVGNYAVKDSSVNVAEDPDPDFNQDQIKSATGNTGSFDPGSDNIRYRKKEDRKKLNKDEYVRLTEAYNNATNLDDKLEAAEGLIRGIERVLGDDVSYIAKTHEEFATLMKGADQRLINEITAGEVEGLYDGVLTYLDVEAIESANSLISTWFHENSHRVIRDKFAIEELEAFTDSVNPKFKNLDYFLPETYKEDSRRDKASEFISRAVEYIVTINSLEDIVNNNIDYDNMPEQLRKFVETIFNTLQNEQLQKNQRGEGRIREARISPRSIEGNGRSDTGNKQTDKGVSERDWEGVHLKRRTLGDSLFNKRGDAAEKSNTLFDNADNLSKVVPNYPDFLNKVLQGSPQKKSIFAEARKTGWDKLDKAIESYMSDVEDADELGRIRELLGVDMPANQLRYVLWRNANPKDGTPKWIAEEALKRRELNGNALVRKGKAPAGYVMNEYERRIRSRHNKGFRGLMFGIEEGWFDRMASLRILQDAITQGKTITDKANAYMLENQLSSRNTSEIRFYNDKLIDPVIEQIHKIFGTRRSDADNYLIAKHGLERNQYMARKEAEKKYEKQIEDLESSLNMANIDQEQFDESISKINVEIGKLTEQIYSKKDYSGLTALAEEMGMEDFHEVAQQIIDDVEGRAPKEDIDNLWKSISNATKWMLDKQYNSGLMTKENYENIRGMYEYYVPLRGFSELTATDLFEYLQNPPSDFNGVVKTARGRTSKSESPVLSILNMGESGIMQANRNRMKQAFYRLVATNPSNYASIEDVWYVKSGNDWQERFPDISPDASGDEVADAIAEFNNEMSELEAKGEAFKGKNKLKVGVKVLPAQASEHAVRVWIGGQEKVIYINGNPRAAQALNGLTQNNLIKKEKARKGVEFWSRQMAANFTSRNPAFMITNFMRDVQFALVSASIKEGGRYSAQLALNVTRVGKTIALNVFGGDNAKNTKFQKYWEEFTANGGETGYANLHSIDQHRKYVNKRLREFSDQRDFLKPFREYTRFMENGNRMIEDMSRFATYVTSRQAGRSIERSVSDAKEITINFNRKGSGGFGANLIHSFYLFANPALQSMRLLGMLAKNHPVRFTAMLSSSMAMGVIVPLMNELLISLFGDDDDKDAYWNMAEWTRRNNLVLYMPWTKDKFITLMLPHELRAFYGIGEMGYSYMNGRLKHTNMATETAKQLSAMLPIDPMSGGDWWVPDAGKPFYQSYISNRNFMDRPIYKDTPWNKLDPEWTKAYKSTPSVLVEAAKWINEKSGGDDVIGGKVNLNPARAYQLFSGYMGGFLTTYTDLANVSFNLLTGRDVSLNDVPVGNKLIRTSDERTEEMRINSEYFYYLDWMREYEHAQSGYKKRAQDKDYRDKYIDLRRSNEGEVYRYAKNMKDLIDKLQDVDEEKAMDLKKKFVEKMWEYEGS